MARRRRRRASDSRADELARGGRLADAPAADDAPAKSDEKPKRQRRGQQSGSQPRSGLGRGFWLYFAFMMAVLIPLNLFCLSNLDQGPGDVQEIQESPLVDSGGPREAYATDPPTSGARALQPAAFGFHASTIADEVQVANLCAGHVIVHFNPSGGAALEAEMNRVARELEGYDVIVHPDAGLGDSEVVLTALLVTQRLDAYDKAEVYNFVRGYSGSRPAAELCPGGGRA
ncbi:MAG: DUF3105 domain-containing protein [Chloroflexi bacterium]|nr:DUF3105 domain-containing protein [Chloroflexota bacterium]